MYPAKIRPNRNRTPEISACLIVFIAIAGLASAEDPDFGNDANSAYPIQTDGSSIAGSLSTGDQDWFWFTAQAQGLYEITLYSPSGTKTVAIYEISDSQPIASFSTNDTITKDVFISRSGTTWLKVHLGNGPYEVSVNFIAVFSTDSYPDRCYSPPAGLTVNAPPLFDAITAQGLDEDWFTFPTSFLHKYQVILTPAFNSNITFNLCNSNCGVPLVTNMTIATLVSLDANDYNLRVHHRYFNAEGYYEVSVTDLGEQPDDYGNSSASASPIPVDGQFVYGSLQYSADWGGDEDWFDFNAAADGLYEITLYSPSGSKSIAVYGLDDSNQLSLLTSFTASNNTVIKDVFISRAGSARLRIYNGSGPYEVSVYFVGSYTTDNYPNRCYSPPAPLEVNAPPLFDVITQQGLDEDWFTFPTALLHKYQISLTQAYNTNVKFDLLNGNCGTSLLANMSAATMVSWDANDYDLKVHHRYFNAEGYYEVSVTDLGEQPDDYGNTSSSASTIIPNGQYVSGSLQYSADLGGDEDWFTFTAVAGLYQVSLQSSSGWKYIAVYELNASGQLQQITSFGTNGTLTNNVTITRAGPCWTKVYNGSGSYQTAVQAPVPVCGDSQHPYPAGDLNHNCVVDFDDFADFAESWLTDNRP